MRKLWGVIVTISREFGSGSLAVASRVAERCSLALVVDELAARAHVEETPRRFVERLADGFSLGANDPTNVAAIADSRGTDIHALESAVLLAAERDDVILVGGAAGYVLGPRANVVRVFLHAPRAWRIARAIEWLGYTDTLAAEEVDRLDEVRSQYVRDRYHAKLNDVCNYDLSIDVSRLGFFAAGDIIATAVDARRRTL